MFSYQHFCKHNILRYETNFTSIHFPNIHIQIEILDHSYRFCVVLYRNLKTLCNNILLVPTEQLFSFTVEAQCSFKSSANWFNTNSHVRSTSDIGGRTFGNW